MLQRSSSSVHWFAVFLLPFHFLFLLNSVYKLLKPSFYPVAVFSLLAFWMDAYSFPYSIYCQVILKVKKADIALSQPIASAAD